MKAFVEITGQVNGNALLKNRIQVGDGSIETKPTMNGYRIYFKTIKQAKAALRNAYNTLVRDEPQMKGKIGGITIYRDNESLMYDASSAVMYRDNR